MSPRPALRAPKLTYRLSPTVGLTLVLLLGVAPASARCTSYEDTPHLVYHLPTWGGAVDVILDGDTAYWSGTRYGRNAVLALDVSDPRNPATLWEVGTSSSPGHLAVSGGLLYVSEYGDLEVFDLETLSPYAFGHVGGGNTVRGLEVQGGLIYTVSNGTFSVSQVSPPFVQVLGSVSLPDAWSLAMVGEIAYTANRNAGIVVVDASDPGAPVVTGTYPMPDRVWELVPYGDFAFVAAEHAGLLTVDLTDPSGPTLVHQVEAGDARGLRLQGTELFVRTEADDVIVFDVTNPLSPVRLRDLAAPITLGFAVDGDYLYTAAGGFGTYFHNSDRAVPTIATWEDGSFIDAVALFGGQAYLTTESGSFVVLDLSDPETPLERGRIEELFFPPDYIPSELLVYGEYVYAIHLDTLRIVSVADPENPTVVRDHQLSSLFGGYSSGYQIVGDRFYGRGGGRIVACSLADPLVPSFLVGLVPPNEPDAIAYDGDRAYVLSDVWNGSNSDAFLAILDLDPGSPQTLSNFYLGVNYSDEVAVRGDRVYISGESYPQEASYIATVDVSDPTSPMVLGLEPGRTGPLYVHGDHLFQAGSRDGVLLYNLADPDAPALVGTWNTLGEAAVLALGEQAVATWPGLLCLAPLPCTPSSTSEGPEGNDAPRLVWSAPNPFRDSAVLHFARPIGQEAGVAIFDAAGRQVRALRPVTGTAGRSIRWDGLDDDQHPVPAGVYWAFVEETAGELRRDDAVRQSAPIVRIR